MPSKAKSKKSRPTKVKAVERPSRLSWLKRLKPTESFHLTRRRDLPKRVKLPKLISFSGQVLRLLGSNWQLLLLLLILHVIVITVSVGVVSQTDYHSISSLIGQITGNDAGGTIFGSILLFGAGITGNFGGSLSGTQQFFFWIVNLLTWLVIIWLMRQKLAGYKVNLRDGLYNGPASFIALLITIFFILLELIPGALGVLIFTVSVNTGVLTGGIEAAMFGLAALLLVVLSIYWLVGGLMSAVAITLPGIYPWAAIRSTYRMVAGNRLPVIGRLVWLGLWRLILWAVILLPVILLDHAVKISWLPLVPITAQVLSSASVIIITVYIYLLYRSLLGEAD